MCDSMKHIHKLALWCISKTSGLIQAVAVLGTGEPGSRGGIFVGGGKWHGGRHEQYKKNETLNDTFYT